MSVGDLYDVERTGEFAVTRVRPRRRPQHANVGADGSIAIAVLTDDAALADAIHDAAAANHPVATVSTLDEALELAAHGRCGILITDQFATQPVFRRMTHRLRETEPALVVIAVGNTGDQSGLISLLSAGIVDRLMLKPVSPSLAQTVLKSAVQQHRTLQGAGTAVALIEPQCTQHEPAVVLVELQRHAANELTEVRLDRQPLACGGRRARIGGHASDSNTFPADGHSSPALDRRRRGVPGLRKPGVVDGVRTQTRHRRSSRHRQQPCSGSTRVP